MRLPDTAFSVLLCRTLSDQPAKIVVASRTS